MTANTDTKMKLRDLASTIRSKNAGVDHITFDVIFRNPRYFEAAQASDGLTAARVATVYRIPPEDIVSFVAFEPAQAIKFTIRRRRPSGSPGEPAVFASPMCPPLFDLEIPVPNPA